MGKVTDLKVDYPGLLKERLPSGNYRYRVRVERKSNKRIRLHVDADHKDFREHYLAARRGIEVTPELAPEDLAITDSVEWFVAKYLSHLEREVSAGITSPATLKQRRLLLGRIVERYGEYHFLIPQSVLVEIRDEHNQTPAQADNIIKSAKAAYTWAIERGLCSVNPAVGVGKIDKGKGGAVPWSIEELYQFRQVHPKGTKAYLALSLFMFTACRVSDVITLGRQHEFTFQGTTWLRWQPLKKGTRQVEIPMLKPLFDATRDVKIVGKTYVLNDYGRPFKTVDSFRNRFKRWCVTAGLPDRSPHGIRKAAGSLLADAGATQHQIMAVHGHTNAHTSEIYTRGANRRRLASEAMAVMGALDW
jgi:integrase